MGGQQGWSNATGAIEIVANRAGRLHVAGGEGHLWATAPRFAWFRPPLVAFTTTFRLRLEDGGLRLIGAGSLTPTVASPVPGRFRIVGAARVSSVVSPSRTCGVLTLQFSVKNAS
jgi:hypothetical protein